MNSNINLIDRVKTNETKDEKADKLKKISFFILISVAFLAIIIFLVNYKFSVSAISKEQNVLVNQLSNYDDTAVKLFILEKRLNDTSKILNNRSTYNETIYKLTNDLSSSVTIDEFELDEFRLNMVLSADSLEDVNDFLNKLLFLSEEELFSNITIEELSIKSSKFVLEIDATNL